MLEAPKTEKKAAVKLPTSLGPIASHTLKTSVRKVSNGCEGAPRSPKGTQRQDAELMGNSNR